MSALFIKVPTMQCPKLFIYCGIARFPCELRQHGFLVIFVNTGTTTGLLCTAIFLYVLKAHSGVLIGGDALERQRDREKRQASHSEKLNLRTVQMSKFKDIFKDN